MGGTTEWAERPQEVVVAQPDVFMLVSVLEVCMCYGVLQADWLCNDMAGVDWFFACLFTYSSFVECVSYNHIRPSHLHSYSYQLAERVRLAGYI